MVEVYFKCPKCKFAGLAKEGHPCPKCGKTKVKALDGRAVKGYHCPKCHALYPANTPVCKICHIACDEIYK